MVSYYEDGITREKSNRLVGPKTSMNLYEAHKS